MKKRVLSIIWTVLSYILVAVLASAVTLVVFAGMNRTKLTQLEKLIEQVYVEDVDWEVVEDAAAWAMVEALPDDWSYYVSASQYEAYMSDKTNSYVGIGLTVQLQEDTGSVQILKVEPGSAAAEAGIQPADILVQVGSTDVAGMDTDQVAQLIRDHGEDSFTLTVKRGEEQLEFTLKRTLIQVQVASSAMLEGNIGYIAITNFNERSADETIAAIEALVDQGAQALIFDVRNNPGGYKDEMVEVLDHLLPEGELFRSVDYRGVTETDKSDGDCLELPMAVLINSESYSAAEFFAAALEEYDWAVTVGQPTVGKGHYQVTYQLSDGSAVALSVGKYYTPNGVSLSDVGGLTPNISVEVDEQTAAMIYAGLLSPEEDPQIMAAVEALK